VAQATIAYRRNEQPNRGLAAAGIVLLRIVIGIPHLLIAGALSSLAQVLAYIGFWIVALTGELPKGMVSLIEMAFRWSARTWGWVVGIADDYPPFDLDTEYRVDMRVPVPENPSRGWAIAGILVFPKLFVLLPHAFVLVFVNIAAALGAWFGHVFAAVTGRLPYGLQDFLAGTIQWNARVYAFLTGLTDDYPPFGLEVSPTA
jgi:hypothetical protein